MGDDGRAVLVGELAAVRVADEVRGVRPEHGEVGDRRSFTEQVATARIGAKVGVERAEPRHDDLAHPHVDLVGLDADAAEAAGHGGDHDLPHHRTRHGHAAPRAPPRAAIRR